MALGRARRTDLRDRAGRPDGVIYRQQYVRCGKASCKKCPPAGPGHGPYWYGFYWDYRQRTRSFYVGKHLPAGVELIDETTAAKHATPLVDVSGGHHHPHRRHGSMTPHDAHFTSATHYLNSQIQSLEYRVLN